MNKYTSNPIVLGKQGVISSQEYGEDRNKTHSEYLNETHFIQNLRTKDGVTRIVAATELHASFDFTPYKRILEIGASPMIQSLTLKSLTNAQYTATDFDQYSIDTLDKFSILKGIDKTFFDAKNLDDRASLLINHHDLVICWGVDYALTDKELENLIQCISAQGKPFILLQPVQSSILRTYLKQLILAPLYHYWVKNNLRRFHGITRSPSYIIKQCKQLGIPAKYLGEFGINKNHTLHYPGILING